MVYPVQLFHSLKNEKKEPLQICWFIATLRKFHKVDSKKLSEEQINAIDIAALCNNIINGFLNNDLKASFNLYISSQLMYGVLRIFKKQILIVEVYCENLLCNMVLSFELSQDIKTKNKLINKRNKKNNEKNVDKLLSETLQEINIQKVFPQNLPEDIHLITEIDCPRKKSDSEFCFGVLENEENLDEIMNQLQKEIMRSNKNTSLKSRNSNLLRKKTPSNEVIAQPLVDKEQHLQYKNTPERASEELLKTPVNRRAPKYGLPGESVLRLSTECAETAYSPPATRRHLSIQDPLNLKLSPSLGKICEPSVADNSSMKAVSEPILEATLPNVSSSMEPLLKNIETPALPLETSAEYEMPSISNISGSILRNNEIPIPREVSSHRNKIIIDIIRQIELSTKLNINASTKPKHKFIKIHLYDRDSAQSLFTMPSTLKKKRAFSTYGRHWSNRLIKLYNNNSQMLHQCTVGDKDQEYTNLKMSNNEMHSLPKIRKIPRIILQRIQVTESKRDDNTINFNTSCSQEQMVTDSHYDEPLNNITFNFPPNFSQNEQVESIVPRLISDSLDELPHLSDNDNNIIQPRIKKLKTSTTELESEAIITEAAENPYLTISDFFTSVKGFWNEIKSKDIKVAFEKVVTPERNRADEVVKYLMYCFELEKNKQMDLKQEQPYATLYLVKP